jgi:hypothetical protein
LYRIPVRIGRKGEPLFYRGPVAFGPLIGAIAAGRKPLVVYYFDEDEGVYRSAYRIDRKLLQAE